MTGILAAGTRLTHAGVSAGPVVAIVGIVAAVAIILVVVVSYVIHHRSMNAGRSTRPGPTQWPTQRRANTSFSAEAGKDEFSR